MKERRAFQLELPQAHAPTRGGRRQGAGRKPPDPKARPNVAHVTRAPHKGRHPVHVTLRSGPGVPSLRSELARNVLKRALQRQVRRAYGLQLQVVHFSLQDDHVHLIVEAADASGAIPGISGLVISLARGPAPLKRSLDRVRQRRATPKSGSWTTCHFEEHRRPAPLAERSGRATATHMRIARLAAAFLVATLVACAGEPADGTEGVDVAESALSEYRIEVKSSAPTIQSGGDVPLAIRVLGANGTPVTEFDDLHTQPMHLVAVSSDLQDFIHIHPTLGDNGVLTVDAPVALAQPYRMFFEYDPAGGGANPQTNRATMRPGGALAVAPNLASAGSAIFDGSRTKSVLVGDTRVELAPQAHGMLMPGMATTLRAIVKTSAGAPATDLVDWLGMPGHAIVLSEDASTFIHAHGMYPGSGGHAGHSTVPAPVATDPHAGHTMAPAPVAADPHAGHGGAAPAPVAAASQNLLDIEVTFPSAGLYKIFVQTKRGENVITAPFVVRVTAM